MTSSIEGAPTLQARVESWECDFNGHWNTRFYCRSFQAAAEVAAALGGNDDPESVEPRRRHLRFHRERHAGDAFEVRSAVIPDAPDGGVVAHFLYRRGELAATALDDVDAGNPALPRLAAADAGMALPRGVRGPIAEPWTPGAVPDSRVELGRVGAADLHRGGTLRLMPSLGFVAATSQHHMDKLGFSQDFTQDTGVGRMLAEMRCTTLGACVPDDFLRASSRLIAAQGKTFHTTHMFYTHRGAPVAMFELCSLAVDMRTRRATDVPRFLTEARV